MIPQLKAKLEAEKAKLPFTSSAFDQAVNILMPVIEKLVEQRNYIYKCYQNDDIKCWSGTDSEFIKEDNQEILKLLEGGE